MTPPVAAEQVAHTPAWRTFLRWGVAAIFAGAGIAKLLGVPWMVAPFAALGVGMWLLYLTAAAELVGALFLLVATTARFAALALIPLIVGAIGTEILVMHRPPLPAIACLGVLLVLVRKPARNDARR